MRSWFLVAFLLLVPGNMSAQSLAEARKLLQAGTYSEAAESYQELLKAKKDIVPATLGLAQALKYEGKYDEALQTVEAALKTFPDRAELLAQQAEFLYERGKWDDAEKSAKKALERNEDQFLARWVLAQITRDKGDWEKAKDEFRWFVKAYNRIDKLSSEDLVLVGQAAVEYARYHHLPDQFTFVLNDIYVDALKEDPQFWQAEYRKASLLLEKYNQAEGAKAINRAYKINPQAAEVKALEALIALHRFEIKDAERLCDEALEINPALPEALTLKADIFLQSGEYAEARKILAKLRANNPRDETVLAQSATIEFLERKPEEVVKIAKAVEGFNPKPHVFYTQLAERLEAKKYYGEAEEYFRKAIDLEPNMPWALNGLGMLYMNMGDEIKAREYLTKAFEADNFNVRVSNYIKVLDHLEKYTTDKTEHYVFRYDPKNDKVLANFMKKALEDIHKEYMERFDFKPKDPYLFELFNRHEMFSGRVIAMPDLFTIGACTGKMMAMVSPRDKDRVFGKPFNWMRVVRHEVVHLFNLEQTNFQIPHWFTEGLAVMLEGSEPPPQWNVLLSRKFHENDLLNLDNILLGFVRPRTAEQRTQAYMQSNLYVVYLMKTHGDKSVGRLLAAFAEGLDNDAALQKAVKTSKADFEKGYAAFLEERVKNLKIPSVRKVRTLKDLKEANAKNPDDLDVAAELAEAYTKISKYKESEKLANQVLQAKPNHPMATYVKAKMLLRDLAAEEAMGILEAQVRADPTEPKTIRLLGELQKQGKKWDAAAETFEKGRQLEPGEAYYLAELAKIYVQTKEKDKLMEILKDVAKVDPDDLTSRKMLAQYYQKKGDLPQAEKYARMALEIVVDDLDIQEILLNVLEDQNKEKELEEFKKLFEKE